MDNYFNLPPELEQRARALHQEAFVFDATLPNQGFWKDEEGDLQGLVDGGVNGASWTVAWNPDNFLKEMDNISRHKKIIERHPDKLRLCTTVAQLEQCKREGVIGLVLHFQDSKPIEDNLEYLRIFYDLGLRVLQLTYNMQGYVGTGCCERFDGGLTYFGLEVVEECNRLGIMIDLSHCSYGTCWDAVKHSKRPVVCTHSAAYALCNAWGRNKPDDLLKAVVDTGGMIGVPGTSPFLKRNPETYEVLQASVDDLLDQIDYMVKLLGVDNVGYGSDMPDYVARTREVPAVSSIRTFRRLRPDVFGVGPTDRYPAFPLGLDSHAKMLNLTRGLVKRSYGDEDVKKILGGNWLRVMREIWGE